MTKYFLVAFLVYGTTIAQGVRTPLKMTNNVFNTNLDFFAMQKVDDIYNNQLSETRSGTIFLFDEIKEVKIYSTFQDSIIFSIPANYNLYTDEFEISLDDGVYTLDPNSVVKIEFDNKTFIPSHNTSDFNYYEILADGKKVDLIRYYQTKVLETQSQTLGLLESKVIVKSYDMFLFPDGTTAKTSGSRSKVFKKLGLTKNESEPYTNLNLKKIENLSYLVRSI